MKNEKYVDKSNLNLIGHTGMAPVHFTARYGTDFEMTKQAIKFLIKNMDNPCMKDESDNNILHYAIENCESFR